jgi:hypothetical protein
MQFMAVCLQSQFGVSQHAKTMLELPLVFRAILADFLRHNPVMNSKRNRRIAFFVFLAGVLLYASLRIFAPEGATVTTASKPSDLPEWASGFTDWTVKTSAGHFGFAKAAGGQVAYGRCYIIHLGPVGVFTLQGPNFRFVRGPHTRTALIYLALTCAVASTIIVLLRLSRRETGKARERVP